MTVDLAGMGTLLLLLLLPGLLVVRAPLAAVPSLSLAFWALSCWWVPLSGGRERFLLAVLVTSGILALLRLRELVDAPRLSRPALVVSAVVLLHLAPLFRPGGATGAEMSFHALAARLVVWNDGLPESLEPLVAIRPFGAHAPALATLAADVSLLSGRPVARCVALVALAAEGLLLLGLFAVYARRLPPAWAAAGAILGLAIARLPEALAPFGEGAPVLALALASGAAAIQARSSSARAAAAAGFVLGAAILAHDLVGLLALGGLVAALRPWRSEAPRRSAGVLSATALLSAVPQLHRLAAALSSVELRSLLFAWPASAHLRWLLAVAALVALPAAAERLRSIPRPWPLVVGVALVAGAGLSATIEWRQGGSGIKAPPVPVLEWAAGLDPLASICTAPNSSGIWIPALVGRSVSAPYLPGVYREEGAESRKPCLLTSFDTLR